MATAEVAARPQQDRPRRKPFTQWVKNLASLKNKEKENTSSKNGGSNPLKGSKHKKSQTYNGTFKNNPYPKSGHHLQQRPHSPASSANGHLSFSVQGRDSYGSLPASNLQERDGQSNGNRSGAPTLATNAGTIHSDAGHGKAATTTTHGGALSSLDGVGADSTFSSPTQSTHSLTTTLTTIQSTSPGNALQSSAQNSHHHGSLNAPNVMFSHQYPISPAPSTPGDRISAIPRHMVDYSLPNTYNAATANNLLTDNASILTLASSSKRRRRSMDTDISMRALAPSSVWGGSRESLPLSVPSGNIDAGGSAPGGQNYSTQAQSRPSIGGLASAERASVYSGVASERNSYISHRPGKDPADAKSMRSITFDKGADAKSLGGDAGSLRGYEGSMKSGKVAHGRNDSLPGSIGSPALMSPRGAAGGTLSRRSSDWQEEVNGKEDSAEDDAPHKGADQHKEDHEPTHEDKKMDGEPF